METPTITITEDALRVLGEAAQEVDETDVLRLTIDAKFHNDLFLGPTEPGDVLVTTGGITVAMNPATARRADGLKIDYVDDVRGGAGFKLENPNQSSPVNGICPADLVELLRKREKLEFIDARNQAERDKASVDTARALDPAYEQELLAKPKTHKLVFIGHHGRQGRTAALWFFERGFTNVWYVVGGIDGWSTMDPDIPRY